MKSNSIVYVVMKERKSGDDVPLYTNTELMYAETHMERLRAEHATENVEFYIRAYAPVEEGRV